MIKKLKQNISFPKLVIAVFIFISFAGSSMAVMNISNTVEAAEPKPPEFTNSLCEDNDTCKAEKTIQQDCPKDPKDTGPLTEKNCDIIKILNVVINIFSGLVTITVIIVVIVAGIQYSASSGDPQAAAAAKKRITNALIAVVAFAVMYGFIQWLVPGGIY